jgi:exodeoxyribonuclease V alpha subunit
MAVATCIELLHRMTEPTPLTYFLKELFPKSSPELLRLLEGTAENAGLLRGDYFTIRDWLEIADYCDAEGLVALLLVMMLALEEGSLCVEATPEAVARRMADVVGADEATRWARRILDDMGVDCFPRLIGTTPADHRPVIIHTIGERRYLYFQKYLRAELDFNALIRQRLERPPPAVPANLAAALHDVLIARALVTGGRSLQLDPDQLLAVGVAQLRNLAIISGGPGTGKTSIVLTLLRCLVRSGIRPDRIALAAPTGRAAQRLSDALHAGLDRCPRATENDSPDRRLRDLGAGTIHQLLAYRPSRNLFGRHAENPIPADVVIVDEVSMVGVVLMAQLMQALEPGARLVLLGDKDQLPSVEAGAVLAALVPEGRTTGFGPELAAQLNDCFPALTIPTANSTQPLRDCVVLLQTNHRSQAQIRAAAQAINCRQGDIIDRLPALISPSAGAPDVWWDRALSGGGCWLLEQTLGTPSELRGFLESWAEQVYFQSTAGGTSLANLARQALRSERRVRPEKKTSYDDDVLRRLFALLEQFRLLTLLREGPWGAVEINRFLDHVLRPRLDPEARGALFAGAPVLITRNDPVRQLHNGDVGVALRQRSGELCVLFARAGAWLELAPEALPAHELGLALTVHKSQGSEYGHVLVVLPPEGGRRLLTKELLYTAITRARQTAILCGTREVLRIAIGRQLNREAGVLQSLS